MCCALRITHTPLKIKFSIKDFFIFVQLQEQQEQQEQQEFGKITWKLQISYENDTQ